MLLSRLFAGLSAAALVASGVAFAAPASAVPDPFTITKERTGANPIVAGSSSGTEFTITVTNNYGEPWEVAVQDLAPPGLTLTGATSSTFTNCLVESSYVTCGPALMDPYETATILVTATADSWVRPSTLVNCAYLGGVFLAPEADSRVNPATLVPCAVRAPSVSPSNGYYGYAEAPVDVINDADLELTASHVPAYDVVSPGAQAIVDFEVKNNGPSGATGPITVKGTLPTGTSFVSGSGEGWTCSSVDQDVECSLTPVPPAAPQPAFLPGSVLLPGATVATLSWTLTTARPGSVASYTVTGVVASPTPDSNPANNTSSTTFGVAPVDVAITKAATGPVNVGDRLVWNLSVSNVGGIDDAGKTTVVDTLPTGSTFVAASGDGWTCAAAGQKVTCTHDGLPKGTTSVVSLTTKVKSGAPRVTNKAEVSTESYESNTADNSSSAGVRVSRIEQTAKPLPASPARVKSGKTDQGKKLRTRVLCRPVSKGALGEVAYCKVTRKGNVVKVKVLGSRKVKVTVIQTAKGNQKYKAFKQRETYIVKP